MIIISHCGYSKTVSERNQPTAFKRSFSQNFGTKADIRDYRGELVISDGMADENCISVKYFFELYNEYYNSLPLALNIQSSGLQKPLGELLEQYKITNCFVFDMSVPDGLNYIKSGIKTFTRQSEFEQEPAFYEQASGVWMEEFESNWITKEIIQDHIQNNKQVCIASPDLKGRNYTNEWVQYQAIEKELGIDNLMLCTQYPELARIFFSK